MNFQSVNKNKYLIISTIHGFVPHENAVHVRGLPKKNFNYSQNFIKRIENHSGKVLLATILERKGTGTVVYSNSVDAKNAIDRLNYSKFFNKFMQVEHKNQPFFVEVLLSSSLQNKVVQNLLTQIHGVIYVEYSCYEDDRVRLHFRSSKAVEQCLNGSRKELQYEIFSEYELEPLNKLRQKIISSCQERNLKEPTFIQRVINDNNGNCFVSEIQIQVDSTFIINAQSNDMYKARMEAATMTLKDLLDIPISGVEYFFRPEVCLWRNPALLSQRAPIQLTRGQLGAIEHTTKKAALFESAKNDQCPSSYELFPSTKPERPANHRELKSEKLPTCNNLASPNSCKRFVDSSKIVVEVQSEITEAALSDKAYKIETICNLFNLGKLSLIPNRIMRNGEEFWIARVLISGRENLQIGPFDKKRTLLEAKIQALTIMLDYLKAREEDLQYDFANQLW